MLASILSDVLHSITNAITAAVGDYGLYAIFLLMLVDAVLPAASELVMVYGGALASGAFAGQTATIFGYELESGLQAYLGVAIAGTVGYLLGSIGGWYAGAALGRPWLERHGRWLHLSAAKLDKAERWFVRWQELAVFLGRLTPVARSFISVPAGVFHARFGPYVWLTLLGSAIWCFAFAGAGWAAGANWERFQDGFRYAEYGVVAAILGVAAWLGWHLLRRRRAPADEPI